MKINISRQSIYLLSISMFLLLFVLLFSFLVLIPKGKEYREQRSLLNKDTLEYRRYEEFSNSTLDKLKQLQADNAHIITALDNSFNSERFEKQHSTYFTSLKLSKIEALENEDEFAVYEVNTTSSINSPQSFYEFLDAINKGDWIIGINFPINFKRDSELITSSFTMKIYSTQKVSVK
ncbi:hypothetical protein SMGD1_1801 [Sulfurimonas gotlandica GD1]|uniref:Uncharacterized protein n=1 Tax=Sulfurimonas gotlandica (strain DSM 19862 / JCM 16533 / GD1) TaxID=929558 RepID=H1FVL1_SULGG|nr:hypothetical protein [Sulfurimonas gotlandica]EHP30324.1 hypothetical protein SMGD1_1801 [Sulfurimonas gotlandica GD1]